MKKFLLIIIIPFLMGATVIDSLVEDMVSPQEGMPHGAPWRTGATFSNPTPPQGFTAMIAWGVIFEDATGSPATNTRVQVRNVRTYLLHSDMRWEEVAVTDRIEAGSYAEWETPGQREEINVRPESSGGISVKMQKGQMVEFLPSTDRANVSPDVIAVYVQAEARLIKDNYWGVNDTQKARYLIAMGGDWWRDCCVPFGDGTNNPGIGFARFKYVTPYWRTFTFSTMVK